MTPRYLNLFLDESIPRCRMRNMRLNEKKRKDMVINFLKYQPTVITPIQLNSIVIERVSSYKLLGVIITNDLSWNYNIVTVSMKKLLSVCLCCGPSRELV